MSQDEKKAAEQHTWYDNSIVPAPWTSVVVQVAQREYGGAAQITISDDNRAEFNISEVEKLGRNVRWRVVSTQSGIIVPHHRHGLPAFLADGQEREPFEWGGPIYPDNRYGQNFDEQRNLRVERWRYDVAKATVESVEEG